MSDQVSDRVSDERTERIRAEADRIIGLGECSEMLAPYEVHQSTIGTWLDAMGYEPMRLDELIARTGRSAAELSARLLDLELESRVARTPGQLYQRIHRG